MNKASRWVVSCLGLGLLMAVVCGCVRTLTKEGLDEKGMDNITASAPDQTFYTGSDADYDYFVIRNESSDALHHYRVRRSEKAVTNRFNCTTNENEWRGYGTQLVVTNGARISK